MEEYIHMFQDEIVRKSGFSPDLEISKELQSSQKIPMLFELDDGRRVLGNLWAIRDRIGRALSVDPREIVPKLMGAIDNPKKYRITDGAFTEKLSSIDDIPVLKFFKEDGGKYLTSAIVSAVWDGVHNLSYHRTLVRDGRLVARLVEGRHTYRMYKEAMEHGEELKVAIFVGAPLEVMLAGATSVDYGISELEIASSLYEEVHGRPLNVSLIGDIPVPSDSEYVILGRITDRLEDEGPFVDITGTLDYIRKQPVIEIDAIYSRPNPIYHTILSGTYEHFLMMGLPREVTIYREVSKVAKVVDLALSPGGCSWLHGVISIKKESEGQPKKVMEAAFKGHKSMKRVIVVDDDIDIHNPEEVEWALATRFQVCRDMVKIHERGSSLDPSKYEDGTTDKWGLDATKPIGKSGFERLIKPH